MEMINTKKGAFFLSMAFVLMLCLQTNSYAALINAKDINDGVDVALKKLREQKMPADTLDKAKGILVFPSVFKGGFFLGGEYGEGALRVNGKTDSYYNISDISFGLSFGGEKKSIVIVFMTDSALKDFKEGSGWTIGGEGSLAIVDTGAGYQGSIATSNKPIVSFVYGEKGLMLDYSLAGAKVTKIHP